jgi:hypothetical protein
LYTFSLKNVFGGGGKVEGGCNLVIKIGKGKRP